MPIYRLGDNAPTLPDADRYWVAPDANVVQAIQDVRNAFRNPSAYTVSTFSLARFYQFVGLRVIPLLDNTRSWFYESDTLPGQWRCILHIHPEWQSRDRIRRVGEHSFF